MFARHQKSPGKDRLKMAGIFLVLAALFPLLNHFTKQPVRTPADLDASQGRLLSYSFADGYRGRHHYCLYFDGVAHPYQIPADFLADFDKAGFEAGVHPGDTLTVSFNRKALVFSVSAGQRNFLSAADTIRIYNHADLQVGLLMIGSGCLILLGRYAYERGILASAQN